MDEEEVSPQAEFLWEWNQKMVPTTFISLICMMFYPLFLHRFYLKQYKEGVVLLVINWTCVLLGSYEEQPAYLLIAVPIMLYEWATIGKRTRRYNQNLKRELKAKWNV